MNLNSSEPKPNGWISLHRKMMDTSWYADSNATRLAVHFLLSATHRDYDTHIGTRKVRLLRGQYMCGRRRLAKELGMGIQALRTAMRVLKESNFITHEPTHLCSIVTVVNYNAYQSSEPDATQQFTQCGVSSNPVVGSQQPTDGSPVTHPIITIKNKLINNNTYSVINKSFEKLWEMYPSKVNKKLARTRFMSSVKDAADCTNCYNALVNYKNSKRVKDGYVQNGATWFNQWEDWISNPDKNETELDKIGDKYGLKRNTSKKRPGTIH